MKKKEMIEHLKKRIELHEQLISSVARDFRFDYIDAEEFETAFDNLDEIIMELKMILGIIE